MAFLCVKRAICCSVSVLRTSVCYAYALGQGEARALVAHPQIQKVAP